MQPTTTVSGGNSSNPNLNLTSDRCLSNPPGDGKPKRAKKTEFERLLDKVYTLSIEKAKGQAKAFIHTLTRPLSEEERTDFKSKLPRCQRLLEKSKDLHRGMHRFSVQERESKSGFPYAQRLRMCLQGRNTGIGR
jgi:hypothetical protein